MKTKIIHLFILLFAFTNTYGQEEQQERRAYKRSDLLSVGNAAAQDITVKRDTIGSEVITTTEKRTIKEEKLEFLFQIGKTSFDASYATNKKQLAHLDELMNSKNALVGLDSLVVLASSSIDGGYANNERIARERSQAMKRTFENRYPDMSDRFLHTQYIAEDWDGFRRAIIDDLNVPYRNEILKIIDSRREPDNKEWVIKTLDNRRPWAYLQKNIFPKQRYGASASFHYNIEREKMIEHLNDAAKAHADSLAAIARADSLAAIAHADSLAAIARADSLAALRLNAASVDSSRHYLAIKTNLLSAAVLTPHLELEAILNDRWSIGAEYYFAQWDRHLGPAYHWELQSVGLEGRYWLSNDLLRRRNLRGWFVGLHANAGIYDFQLHADKGLQGEFLVGGVVAGYSLGLAKKLNLEFSFGGGYAHAPYRRYVIMGPDLVRDGNDRRWGGPMLTKLEIALTWIIF